MPFRDVKGLDTDTLEKMTQVFNMACERLGLEDDHPERAELAQTIVELVSRGERDAGQLYALTIEAMDRTT
jgi:hypothetical protein